MQRKTQLVLGSALLAALVSLDGGAFAQRGRGSAPAPSSGSVGRSSGGGSIGRSAGGGSIGRSSSPSYGSPSVQGRSAGRSLPTPSPSAGARSIPRSSSPAPSITPRSPSSSVSSRSSPSASPSARSYGRTYGPADAGRGSVGSSAGRGDATTGSRSVTPSPSRGLSPLDDRLRTADPGPAAGRVYGPDRLGSARDSGATSRPETTWRSRPSTSDTSFGGRGAGSVADLPSATGSRTSRTPFPSPYRTSPEGLSGARLSARDRLESQSAQHRIGGESLRLSDRAGTSDILDRYSHGAGAADRPASDVATRPSGPGLSSARRAGAASRAPAPEVAGRGSDLGRSRTGGRVAGQPRSANETGSTIRTRSASRDVAGERSAAKGMRERYAGAQKERPAEARTAEKLGRTAGVASDVAFRSALTASGIPTPAPSSSIVVSGGWSSDLAGGVTVTAACNTSCWYWNCWYPSFCWSWWGSGWGWSFCWGGYYPYYPYYYSYWNPYGWYYPAYYYPYYYSYYPAYVYSPPVVYQTVYYGDAYSGDGETASAAPEQEPATTAPEAPTTYGANALPPAGAERSLAVRATSEYLSLGDRAFREGSYGRAVRYYAKAVEYSPDDAVLYLVLSDALFATGDYHYAAYALRRALELDPELTLGTVDKHQFYGKPSDFDAQLVLLETYLADHYMDDDARLVLAANYLFGGSPEKAVELLENPFSLSVRESESGVRVLASARAMLDAKR